MSGLKEGKEKFPTPHCLASPAPSLLGLRLSAAVDHFVFVSISNQVFSMESLIYQTTIDLKKNVQRLKSLLFEMTDWKAAINSK